MIEIIIISYEAIFDIWSDRVNPKDKKLQEELHLNYHFFIAKISQS
ncbi:MAG: hypothetical protein ACUVQ1_05695 [Candidatus Kapaibacteriales bacterium]